jgi:formylglycine-generating enzyme
MGSGRIHTKQTKHTKHAKHAKHAGGVPSKHTKRTIFAFGLVAISTSACVLLLFACANVLGIEDRFFNADALSAPDAPQQSDSGDSGPPTEAGEEEGGPCLPKMVSVGPFCIDATEVSQREYAAFLAAMSMNGDAGGDAGAGIGNQIAECATTNTSFSPGPTCTPFSFNPASDYPMACIDWCDAFAYCAWQGKRLCGLVDGGSVPHEQNLFATTSDQWFAACSRNADGFHKYPYGNDYDGSVCNTKDYGEGGIVPVGSAKSCVGGYAGLYDMSGNVWEWEDSCRPVGNDSGASYCVVRGGGYQTGGDFFPDQFLSCLAHYDFNQRTTTNPDTGFRCCSR